MLENIAGEIRINIYSTVGIRRIVKYDNVIVYYI